MKTIITILLTFSILSSKAQFVYVSSQYAFTEKGGNAGLHVGWQFRNKDKDNQYGFVSEFTAATEAGSFFNKGSITKHPQYLFLQGGYTMAFDKLQVYLLGGVCLYSIGHWNGLHTDVINSITFPLVVSGRVSYGSVFVQGNLLKGGSGIEGGFIMKFIKD